MDEKFREIIESLPVKRSRSRPEPYRQLIAELRRLRRTYREIAQVLGEKCQLQVSAAAVHNFVRLHLRRKRNAVPRQPSRFIATPPVATTVMSQRPSNEGSRKMERPPAVSDEEVRRRIQDLKRRSVPATDTVPALFLQFGQSTRSGMRLGSVLTGIPPKNVAFSGVQRICKRMIETRNGTDGKTCSRCRKWKPLINFPPDSSHGSSQGGRHCRCHACHRKVSCARRQALKSATGSLTCHNDRDFNAKSPTSAELPAGASNLRLPRWANYASPNFLISRVVRCTG